MTDVRTHVDAPDKSPAPEQSVRFSIERIEAWAPGLESAADWDAWARGERTPGVKGEPPLKQMAPMLRRHAAQLGRMACDVAYRALGDRRDVPMVFCSRYGEVDRSVALLTALADGSGVTPTSFGLSVHNAVPGLFTMARREQSNCIAMSAGTASTEYGVIEAVGLLTNISDTVLIVSSDCAVPDVYSAFSDQHDAAFAWAALLHTPNERSVELSWRSAQKSDEVRAPREPGGLRVLRALLGRQKITSYANGVQEWRWRH